MTFHLRLYMVTTKLTNMMFILISHLAKESPLSLVAVGSGFSAKLLIPPLCHEISLPV